jgi:hypothetical protein
MTNTLWFWTNVLLLCYSGRDYLIKPSPYYQHTEISRAQSKSRLIANSFLRPIDDLCVISSASYLLVALFLFQEGYSIHLVVMNIICFASSLLYHLHAEAAFFNLDNIFATAQAFTFIWSLWLAYLQGRYQILALGVVGIGLSAYLLVACGLPAILDFDSSNPSLCRCRRRNPAYKLYHSIWHAISIGGPVIAAIVIKESKTSDGMEDLVVSEYLPGIPLVPAASLLLSAVLNLYGNMQGIMPLK